MKKKYLALLFALLMSLMSVQAAEVTPAKAAAVAKQIHERRLGADFCRRHVGTALRLQP